MLCYVNIAVSNVLMCLDTLDDFVYGNTNTSLTFGNIKTFDVALDWNTNFSLNFMRHIHNSVERLAVFDDFLYLNESFTLSFAVNWPAIGCGSACGKGLIA